MPAIYQSDAAKGILPTPNPAFAGHAVAYRYAIALTVALVANDVIELGVIPPNCRLIDIVLDADDMDSGGPTLAFDVGIMTGTYGDNDSSRTVNAVFFAASTIGQAVGIARPTLVTAYRDVPTASARAVGLKCTTAATTFAAGTIAATITVASL